MTRKLTEAELTAEFDSLLDDDENEWVDVLGHRFAPSKVLKELDPILYKEELSAYADDLQRDGVEIEGW